MAWKSPSCDNSVKIFSYGINVVNISGGNLSLEYVLPKTLGGAEVNEQPSIVELEVGKSLFVSRNCLTSLHHGFQPVEEKILARGNEPDSIGVSLFKGSVRWGDNMRKMSLGGQILKLSVSVEKIVLAEAEGKSSIGSLRVKYFLPRNISSVCGDYFKFMQLRDLGHAYLGIKICSGRYGVLYWFNENYEMVHPVKIDTMQDAKIRITIPGMENLIPFRDPVSGRKVTTTELGYNFEFSWWNIMNGKDPAVLNAEEAMGRGDHVWAASSRIPLLTYYIDSPEIVRLSPNTREIEIYGESVEDMRTGFSISGVTPPFEIVDINAC